MSDIKRRVARLEQAQPAPGGGVLFVIMAEGETQEAAIERTAAARGRPAEAFGTVFVLSFHRPG